MSRVLPLALVAACGFTGPSLDPSGEHGHFDGGTGLHDGSEHAMTDASFRPPVTVDCPASADTYLDQENQILNFGSQRVMYVDGESPQVSLVRFDLSAIPTTATISSATLLLTTTDDEGDPDSVYQMLAAWSELDATWYAPDGSTSWNGAAPPARNTVVLGTIDPSAETTQYSVTIPPLIVAGWVSTPITNDGFAIASTESDGTNYATREATQGQPILRVTYQP